MKNNAFVQRLIWTALTVIFVVLILQWVPWVNQAIWQGDGEPRPIVARGDLADDEKSTIKLFEQASPSVVFISVRKRVVDLYSRDVLSVPRGTGSGFIWDEQGHVVTNSHVIEKSSQARVRLNDGRSYDAVLVGRSPEHDLAVLRINVPFNRPPPVPLGTSGDLKVGQKVFAIGNPFGLDYTLTSGIISALNRSLGQEIKIDNLIQTDAAINPGNSGGPLLDSAGRLIGINTAIYSPSGAYAGIGFSVPVDTVNRVVPQLIAKGRYTRPNIGISVDENVNRMVTKELQVKGVLIIQVQQNSAAAAAGLRGTSLDNRDNIIPGDVILAVNGEKLDSISGLLTRLDNYNIGDKVSLSIWRKGKTLDVDVVLQGNQK